MSLRLTGKGSILGAIGGALNTAGNAVVAGVKDVGDLGSLGIANLTHNQQAAQNARTAISSNDSNLSGQSFPARAVNDVYDKTALPMYQGLIGDTPSGLATGPVGTPIREFVAEHTGNPEAYQHAKEQGASASATFSKNLPRELMLAGTEGGVKDFPEGEVPKPEINEKAAPTPKEPPPKAAPDDSGPKITVSSQPNAGDIQVENPPSEAPEPNPAEPTPPEPSPDEIRQATESLNASLEAPGIDWTRVAGANQELDQTTQSVAQQLRAEDAMQNEMTGPTDLYKQIKDHGGIGASDYEDIPNHLKRKGGPSMDRVAQELGYPDDASLHEAILNEGDRRAKGPTPLKSMAEYRELAARHIHANPDQFDNVTGRAAAERDYQAFQKADKGTGYNKAKWQIPKGAPAKRFIQALYDKTHSPEYAARNSVGAKLGDVRNTLKGARLLRDRAQKELNMLSKKGSGATEDSIRSKAAEVRSLGTRYNALKGMEQHHALTYKTLAAQLDEKFPEINLSAKKGVRLTSNQQAFETARPVESSVPEGERTVTDSAGNKVTESELIDRHAELSSIPRDERTATQATQLDMTKNLLKKLSEPSKGVTVKTPEDPMAAIIARNADKPAYSGPNLNEDAFSPEDVAKLEAQIATEEAANTVPHSVEGDTAILEGIKKGDSDADILKSYQEATGSDEATAKKALGIIEDNPNVDKVGAVENNPHYGKLANYDVTLPQKGALVRSLTYGRRLIGKAMLRAHAPSDQLAIKLHMFANHAWEELGPEDRALADSLRNHSIDEVAAKADNPEAFRAYAGYAKDIEDYIHAARGQADPYDVTPYRQNYGAGFHLQDENGKPVSISQFEGQSHAFQLGRHFSNYADLEEASGMKRSTQDFHEDLTKDVIAAQHHITTNSLYFGLKQAFGDSAVALGKPTSEARTPLSEYPGVFARDDIARRINSRARYAYDEDKMGSALHRYDAINSSMKNVKLSLGGFHNVNIMLNQAALNPAGISSSAAAWANPTYFRARMEAWDRDGTLEKALHSGLTLGGGNEFDSAVNKLPLIKQAHDALFKRQIPFSKMQVFDRYTHGLDLNNPEDYDTMRGVARGLNNTFGGINRLVDGMNYTRLKQFGRGVLAADYNEGQIRTLLTSLDPRKIGTVEGRLARQVVVGRAVILSLPGTAQAAMNGQLPSNPKKLAGFYSEQLVNPTLTTHWKTTGGTPKRVTLIAGIVNKADRAIAPAFDSNNPDKASGLKQELVGNEAPAESLTQSEINNKDYYGNKMRTGNPLQDAANALNASAPIPISPAARVVAGSRFGNNPLVKIASGGQSPKSPGEAAIDISGVGRVSADPNAPVMQILNHRQEVVQSLKGDEQAQAGIYAVHPGWDQNLTKQQVADKYNDVHYEENKWNALQNPNVFAALKKQNDFAAAHGEPSDPLFSLSPKDQHTILTYKYLTAVDPGSDSNDKAAVIFADNKDMITKYGKDESAYYNAQQQLYQSSGGLKGDPANTPQIVPGGVPYPSILQDPKNQQVMDGYTALLDAGADTATKQKYIADHPQVQQMFDASFNYENARAAALGQPLEKAYPKAPPALEDWITRYIAADKAGRTALRKSDMTSFTAMQNYMAQVDEFLLARTAGQAKYQGHDFSQANLKEIYSLGKYDIAKKAGADGNDTYSVDPEAAFAGGSSGSGGSSRSSFHRSSSSKIGGLTPSQRRESKGAVKFAYHPAKVYIRGKKNPRFQKVKIASAKRRPISVKAKSTPVT